MCSRRLCLLLAFTPIAAAAAALTDPIQTGPTTQPAQSHFAAQVERFLSALPPPMNLVAAELRRLATQPVAPTTAPAASDDPQRSPRQTLKTFLLALNEAKSKPQRIVDAVGCLDLSALPTEERVELGPLRAEGLGEIIDALFRRDGRSTEDVPDYATGPPHVLHVEGELSIALAQQQDGRWRFTADSVAAIPAIRQSIARAATTQQVEPPAATDVPIEYRSARATMSTFLRAQESGDAGAAARCLDLGDLPAPTREQTGRRLATRLREVMDRIKQVVPQDISDRPDDGPYTYYLHEKGRIEIAAQQRGDRKGQWLFTAETVRSIEPLFTALEQKPRVVEPPTRRFWDDPSLWVRDRIPPELKERHFGAELWQWIGMAIVLLTGVVTQRIASILIRIFTIRRLGRNRIKLSRPTMTKFVRPFGMLTLLLTWGAGLQLLDLEARTFSFVAPPLRLAVVVTGVWAAYRLIDLISVYMNALAERTMTKVDDVLVPLLRKTVKIVLLAVSVLVILGALGIQEKTVTTVFAGLGLGGLAFALAAQDTLKNFFGSVTVVIDRPFQVGDWIKVGDVEGEVQSVGLRSTRLRTFLDSEVTIPNANLINANVDNLGRRIYRRLRTFVNVTYSTPAELIEAFCEAVRELIRRHPYTRKEEYHVYVHDFGDSSINILLTCFFRTPDWATELRERERLLIDVLRVAERLGVQFAFPTRTIALADGVVATIQPSAPLDARESRTSAPPRARSLGVDVTGAHALGRNTAAAVVSQSLPGGEKPPPVSFDGAEKPGLSPSETRFL